jgi:hypothetical protein
MANLPMEIGSVGKFSHGEHLKSFCHISDSASCREFKFDTIRGKETGNFEEIGFTD